MKTTYRNHQIELVVAGHPQCQNIVIDGEEAGFVIFPGSAIAKAKKIIDDRLRTQDFVTLAQVQINEARNQKGAGR